MRRFMTLAILLSALPACRIDAAELQATAADAPKPNVLLVTGQDMHDWKSTAPVVVEILQKDPRLHVRVVEDPSFLADPSIHEYDAIVMH